MGRKPNQKQLDQLRDSIQDNPKQRPSFFSRLLGSDNKSVARALPQLEERGDLLMEDDNGRISWFGKRKN